LPAIAAALERIRQAPAVTLLAKKKSKRSANRDKDCCSCAVTVFAEG